MVRRVSPNSVVDVFALICSSIWDGVPPIGIVQERNSALHTLSNCSMKPIQITCPGLAQKGVPNFGQDT